ncbi:MULTISPECIES: phosphatase PAP2 family protein [Deferrisoma]
MSPVADWELALLSRYAAARGASPWLDGLAKVLASAGPWGTAGGLIALWVWGSRGIRDRVALLEATAAGLLGLGVNQLFALLFFRPRPYMMGLVQPLITHAYETSFPSDHATLLLGVGLYLLLLTPRRRAGAALSLLALGTAWARVYAGVHFPTDILGSAGVAAAACIAVRVVRRPLAPHLEGVVRLYARIAKGWIHRGWVRGVSGR